MRRTSYIVQVSLAALATALAGIISTALVYQRLIVDQTEQQDARFRYDAVQRAELIKDAFSGLVDSMESAGRFLEEAGIPACSGFERFVSPWIQSIRFSAILWVVPEGSSGFKALYSVPENIPVSEVSAMLELQSVRNAVGSARRLQRLTASDLTELPWSGGQPTVAICRPVSCPEARAGDTSFGIIIGIVSLQSVIEGAILATEPMGLPTEIWDAGSSPADPAFKHRARIGLPVDAGHSSSRLVYTQTMTFADKLWTIQVRPSTKYAVTDDRSATYLALAGVFASIVLTMLVITLVGGKSRAEARAAEKTMDFENFFTTSLDLFAIAGTDGVFKRLNRQWIATLGYPLEELEGARFIDFIHPDDQDATLQAVRKLGAGVEIVSFVNRYLAKDGTYRNIEWRSTIGMGGKAIFAAARDITGRIAMEESMRHVISEKESLIKEVHHRVKNNMQVISSLLDLEAMNADEPRFAEAVRESQGRIRTMAMVHEQLYRRDSMSDVDLGGYLRELVGRVAGEYADNPVDLSIEADVIPLDLDAAIPCGLAVNELVTNAFKYSHVEGRKMALCIQARSRDGVCSIFVEDNGPGLPAGALERSLSGTSLGLGLVSGLAAQLKGELRILPGPGARFELRFPYL